MENAKSANIMGTMPINKLLLKISGPMIISMLIQSLYNVVDSMFVAQISEDALTAVSLAFPLFSIMIGVGVGTAVGIGANLARLLGEKKFERANLVAINGFFLSILTTITFMIIGFFFSETFMKIQTDIPNIIQDGTIYLKICTFFSCGIFVTIASQSLLESTGRTMYSMIGQCTGAIINIILDPILIFGLFGMPALGIAGAAYATVFSQMLGLIVSLCFNHTKNKDIELKIKGFRPDASIIKVIYKIGIPVMINNSLMPIMALGMNTILMTFSSSATAVMGVLLKFNSFVFMPILGMNNGLTSIVAYNYEFGQKDRIIRSIKLAIKYSLFFTIGGMILYSFLAEFLLGGFLKEASTMKMGITAFKIVCMTFVFSGITFILCSAFQALGEAKLSLYIQLFRQILILLPLAYLLSLSGNVDMVWFAFVISDIIGFCICIIIFKNIYKNTIQNIQPPKEEHNDIKR